MEVEVEVEVLLVEVEVEVEVLEVEVLVPAGTSGSCTLSWKGLLNCKNDILLPSLPYIGTARQVPRSSIKVINFYHYRANPGLNGCGRNGRGLNDLVLGIFKLRADSVLPEAIIARQKVLVMAKMEVTVIGVAIEVWFVQLCPSAE